MLETDAVQPLLQLAINLLGRALCSTLHPFDLALVPEEELTEQVFWAWQRHLRTAHVGGGSERQPPPLARQHQVLSLFAAACWRPQLLRLAYCPAPPSPCPPPGLPSLGLVAQRLLHLEISAPSLTHLDAVAACCPHLRCLSLRGCTSLGDASLAALAPLTTLRALDLSGLPALADGAVFHVARLPQLAALNLSGMGVGDGSLEMLTYGHRVGAWKAASGAASLPPEAASWPALPLEHLQVAGTRVGPTGLAELTHLPQLRFLDTRGTGVTRAVLGPLQRRFALESVQAAVLTASNSAAAAVVNYDCVACRCGCAGAGEQAGAPGAAVAATDLQGWQAAGLQLLLHFDPAAGLAGLLAAPPGSSSSKQPWLLQRQEQQQEQGAAQQVGIPGGRRMGYRQPREERGEPPGAGHSRAAQHWQGGVVAAGAAQQQHHWQGGISALGPAQQHWQRDRAAAGALQQPFQGDKAAVCAAQQQWMGGGRKRALQ